MALDRFLYFPADAFPTQQQIRDVVAHYVGPSATIKEQGCRIFVEFPGDSFFAEVFRPERFIEIFVANDNVDVMTRMADPFTNCVANGIAKWICVQFNGEQEDRSSNYPGNYLGEMEEFFKWRWSQTFPGELPPQGLIAIFDQMLHRLKEKTQ